jgi:hypothetical protein
LVRNYTVGTSKTVAVGETMIRFQDYWTETVDLPVMIPNTSVGLSGGPLQFNLMAGKKYPIKGRITFDGVEYTAVALSDDPAHNAVLVKQDGALHNRVLATGPGISGYVQLIYTYVISNPAVRLTGDSTQLVKATKGYENFELLYAGLNSNGLNVTYREFSPDGLARVAFFQNLTYEIGAKSIAFKQYRIAIEKATSELITFTVTTDGR